MLVFRDSGLVWWAAAVTASSATAAAKVAFRSASHERDPHIVAGESPRARRVHLDLRVSEERVAEADRPSSNEVRST